MYENQNTSTQYQLDVTLALNSYIARVFGIMFAGLAVTAFTAFYFSASNLIINLGNGIFAIIIIELILVMALSAAIKRISYGVALTMFIAYSFLNGITLSIIFIIYELGSIATAFTITAATFGIMAIYGHITKNDLTGFGSLAGMFLIGGLITMFVNFFLGSAAIDYIVSVVLLVVFVGLVAYDTQKLKGYFFATQNDEVAQRKLGIIGALSLYLDFINIFIRLLRIFGRRK
ncbi:MAG: Inner membrane protein YbhL [Firmicutes bacterium ADurb.Bin193]|nr:MAG: Inner membrane protein YbhL [Firmicutes bacterium ADurb.Bin193]